MNAFYLSLPRETGWNMVENHKSGKSNMWFLVCVILRSLCAAVYVCVNAMHWLNFKNFFIIGTWQEGWTYALWTPAERAKTEFSKYILFTFTFLPYLLLGF